MGIFKVRPVHCRSRQQDTMKHIYGTPCISRKTEKGALEEIGSVPTDISIDLAPSKPSSCSFGTECMVREGSSCLSGATIQELDRNTVSDVYPHDSASNYIWDVYRTYTSDYSFIFEVYLF